MRGVHVPVDIVTAVHLCEHTVCIRQVIDYSVNNLLPLLEQGGVTRHVVQVRETTCDSGVVRSEGKFEHLVE